MKSSPRSRSLRWPAFALLSGAATMLFAAPPEMEFVGVIASSAQIQLILRERTSDTAHWILPGGSVGGYTVTDYDPKTETIGLTKGDESHRLRLISAQIRESASAAVPAKLTIADARVVYDNLRYLSAASDQFYLGTGKKTTTGAELIALYAKQVKPVAGEDYATMEFRQDNPLLAVKTASGETIRFIPGDDAATSSSFYAMKPGDTLAEIARKFGTSVAQLAVTNEITDPARLRTGMLLRVR